MRFREARRDTYAHLLRTAQGLPCAWDRVAAHAAARKLAAVAELARRNPAPPDQEFTADQLAYALAESRGRDSAEDINKRFRAAKREIHMAKGSRAFDYMVINDNLDRAVEEIIKIIKHKRAGGI